jgi:hypothetical protein
MSTVVCVHATMHTSPCHIAHFAGLLAERALTVLPCSVSLPRSVSCALVPEAPHPSSA